MFAALAELTLLAVEGAPGSGDGSGTGDAGGGAALAVGGHGHGNGNGDAGGAAASSNAPPRQVLAVGSRNGESIALLEPVLVTPDVKDWPVTTHYPCEVLTCLCSVGDSTHSVEPCISHFFDMYFLLTACRSLVSNVVRPLRSACCNAA
jgi:hypothetical protein